MNFLGMGPLELVVICALALIVFGPDKLPEIAQQVGRAIREVRKLGSEVTDELQKSIEPERRQPPAARPPADAIAHQPPPPPAANPASLPTSQPVTQPVAQPVTQKETTIEPPY